MSKRIRVVKDVFSAPLLETDEANIIEFYDDSGKLVALLTRVFGDVLWCFSCKKDPDWAETLIRHGYADLGKRTLKELLG